MEYKLFLFTQIYFPSAPGLKEFSGSEFQLIAFQGTGCASGKDHFPSSISALGRYIRTV